MGLLDGTFQYGTTIVIIYILLLYIEVDNSLGGVVSNGSFEGIYEGVTHPLALTLYGGNALVITDDKVLIILGCY